MGLLTRLVALKLPRHQLLEVLDSDNLRHTLLDVDGIHDLQHWLQGLPAVSDRGNPGQVFPGKAGIEEGQGHLQGSYEDASFDAWFATQMALRALLQSGSTEFGSISASKTVMAMAKARHTAALKQLAAMIEQRAAKARRLGAPEQNNL